MESIGRIKASIWFWLFMIIVVLVLQNIMLAILMEAYSNVKNATRDSLTVAQQIKKMYRRWQQARQMQRVRLNDIFDALLHSEGGDEEAMLKNPKHVFPDQLEKTVPNLKAEQAVRTLTDSQKDHEKRNSEPFTVHSMSVNISKVKERMDNALVCSAFVATKMDEYDEIERPTEGYNSEEEKAVLSRSKTIEGTGQKHAPEAASSAHVDDDFLRKKSQLKEGLEQIRKISQKSTVELSDAMEAVLAEEMQALEKKQKEQQKSMEQMQASLQSLRSLAYKLSETCTEVATLSAEIAPDDRIPTVMEQSDGGAAPDGVVLWSPEAPPMAIADRNFMG